MVWRHGGAVVWRHGGAPSLPAVDLLVLPEHSLHGESFLADVTLERSLSGVRPLVFRQPGGSAETLAADVARKLQRPLVELQVLLQLLHGGEIFEAQEAAMKRFLLVFTDKDLFIRFRNKQAASFC